MNVMPNYSNENKTENQNTIYNSSNQNNKTLLAKTEDNSLPNCRKPTYFRSKSLNLNSTQLDEIVNKQNKLNNNINSIQKLNESSTAEDSSSLRNTNEPSSNNNIRKIHSIKNGLFISKTISNLTQIAEHGINLRKTFNTNYKRGMTLNNNHTVTLSANHYERNNTRDNVSTMQPQVKREINTSSYNRYLSTFQDIREIKGCTINLGNTRFAQVTKPTNLIQTNETNNKTGNAIHHRMNVNNYNTNNINSNNNNNTNNNNTYIINAIKKSNTIAFRPSSLTACSSLSHCSFKNISKLKTLTADKGYTIQLARINIYYSIALSF